MAVSDVLFDAAEQIDKWLADFPDMYSDMDGDIRKVVADMRRIQTSLDRPPDLQQLPETIAERHD